MNFKMASREFSVYDVSDCDLRCRRGGAVDVTEEYPVWTTALWPCSLRKIFGIVVTKTLLCIPLPTRRLHSVIVILSVVAHHWLLLPPAAAAWLLLDSVVIQRTLKSYWIGRYDDDLWYEVRNELVRDLFEDSASLRHRINFVAASVSSYLRPWINEHLTLYRMVMPIGTPFLKEKINN